MDLNIFKNRSLNKEHILQVDGYTFTKTDLIGGVSHEQTVNSGEDIVLGSCTSASIEFTLNNMNQLINNLAGKEITWEIKVEISPGVFEDVPMGIFIADKPVKINDLTMSIKAYDRMTKFDINVDSWLSTVSYPITLKNYLLSLCSYVGVTLATTNFINESFPIKFNFIGENVTGRQVLKWISEIAAKYAVINELGQLKISWFNSIVYGVNNSNYYDIQIEDYTVKKIDKLQVQVVENDIGVIVGTGTNAYVIQGNPLLYADTDAEIRPYVETIYNAIKDFTYIPFNITVNANPLIKPGNTFQVTTRKGQVFNAVVMSRNMIGWSDVYSATGNKSRAVNTSINQSIQQIRGKQNTLERTIERTVSQLYDADSGDLTILLQTVSGFNTRVQTLESNMNFRFQQDTPPIDPEVGDVWLNTNPNGFIVDLLTMLVNDMLQPVDYYNLTLNKSYRWTGTQWEHVEDGAITELRMNVSEIDQTVDLIALSVQAYDGRIGSLEVTANSITSRVTASEGSLSEVIQTANTLTAKILNAEGDISTLEQTATSLTSRISNAEGSLSTVIQTANSIQLQVNGINSTVGSHTSSINILSNEINSVVSFTDVSGYEIASKIQQSASAINLIAQNITLDADQIDMLGIVNVNRYLQLGDGYDSYASLSFGRWADIQYDSGDLDISTDGAIALFATDGIVMNSYTMFRDSVSFINADVEGIVACYYPTNWFYMDYGGGSYITVRSKSGSSVGRLYLEP